MIAQLLQLSALCACNPDTRAPKETRFPPANYNNIKIPSIQPAVASARVCKDNLSLNVRTPKVRDLPVDTGDVENNPLSSALKQQAETESGDTLDVDVKCRQKSMTDAPIDNDTKQAISQSTKEQLEKMDNPFRIALHKLVCGKLDSSQAAAVDRAYEEFLFKL
ncbi:hypothetical protein GGF37_003220 [Kickxella alabastrina]|nr:hypothetical protein GGF37_003220 [Kickxella alabastrina]